MNEFSVLCAIGFIGLIIIFCCLLIGLNNYQITQENILYTKLKIIEKYKKWDSGFLFAGGGHCYFLVAVNMEDRKHFFQVKFRDYLKYSVGDIIYGDNNGNYKK